MSKLAAFMAAGVVATCAYASAENTVTLNRDVLGRSIGTNAKPVTMVKTSTVKSTAASLAKVSASRVYNSMAEVYDAIGTDPSIPSAKGAFDNTSGSEKYEYNDKKNLSKSTYLSYAEAYERNYQNQKNYVSPQVAVTPYVYKESGNYYVTEKYQFDANAAYITLGTNRYDGVDHVIADNGIDKNFINAGGNGNGVNIRFNIMGSVLPQYVTNTHQAGRCTWTDNRNHEQRSTQTRNVNVINRVAPGSGIYVYDIKCDEDNGLLNRYPEKPEQNNLLVGVHSLCAGPYTMYGDESANLDDYVYYNRTVEIAADGGCYYASNSIGVDGPNGGTGIRDNQESSVYKKPDMYNLGNFYLEGEPTIYFGYSEGNYVENHPRYPIAQDGAGASSYTAGLVADLLSKYPFYKWHPEVVKALLLSVGGIRKDGKSLPHEVNGILDNQYIHGGTYRPDVKNMANKNRSRYWIGNSGDFFKSGQSESVKELNLKKGVKYRIAIAWLNKGSYKAKTGNFQQDYDLIVQFYGKNDTRPRKYYKSENGPTGYEVIEFTPDVDGWANVIIKRYASNGGRVMLGYNLHQF